MRVFVSLPVKNWSKTKIENERSTVLGGVPGYFKVPPETVTEVPMIEPWQLQGQHPVYCLAFNLQMMCQADVVMFHPEWIRSKACRLQHEICEQYDIPHVDLSYGYGGEDEDY